MLLALVLASCDPPLDLDAARGCADECLPQVGCCSTFEVPGGTFDRGYDRSDDPTQDGGVVDGWQMAGQAPATVARLEMDTFEVTVGRFARFVEAYDRWHGERGHPAEGQGAHPTLGLSSGWRSAWDEELPLDAAALEAMLVEDNRTASESCVNLGSYGRGEPLLPINCVNWYVAFAFCIWDGGRLPTEAEWNFAAAGGDEQRAFPWSDPPSDLSIDESHAVLRPVSAPLAVGSRAPVDTGRFGGHDFAGNVREWVLDAPGEYPDPCMDCARIGLDTPVERVRRGGDYGSESSRGRTAHRSEELSSLATTYTGVRCVRD